MGTRAPYAHWCNGGGRGSTRLPDAKVDYEAKAGEIAQGVGSQWIGILAIWTGGFHPVSLGWVPWCLLPRPQQTWLYSLNWTHDQSHWQYPIQRMIQMNCPTIGRRQCWIQAQFAPARVCGVMNNAVVLVQKMDGGLCFCIDLHHLNGHMKKTLTPCLGSRKCWRVWLVLAIFHAWTWSLDSGKLRWMSCQNSTLHLLLVA